MFLVQHFGSFGSNQYDHVKTLLGTYVRQVANIWGSDRNKKLANKLNHISLLPNTHHPPSVFYPNASCSTQAIE